MSKLLVIVGLTMALALALPDSTQAASFTEVKKLLGSDAQYFSRFGWSVAVSSDTAIVGAVEDNTGGYRAGAAYVFQRGEGGTHNWGEITQLLASDAQSSDFFGRSVAISGDTAVVGAEGEDAEGSTAGAAYVFQRDQGGQGTWGEVRKLTASDAAWAHWFGFSVAINGDIVVVGAKGDNAGVDCCSAGSAYVFDRHQGGKDNWGEVKKLTPSDAQAFDRFGTSVAISGDNAIVGAQVSGTGAAYVFQRNQGGEDNWGEVKKLTAPPAQGLIQFGLSVAVSGDSAVVGAYMEHSGGNCCHAGAAHVFQRNEGGEDNWGEVKKLTASDAQSDDRFGLSVAVSGDTAVVGANPANYARNPDPGAAYVFERNEGGADNWGEAKKLTASDAQASQHFGISVAVSGEEALVGADGAVGGVRQFGAVYVFDLLGPKSTSTSTPTVTITPTSTIARPPTETPRASVTPTAMVTPPATNTPPAAVTPTATVPPPGPTLLPPVGAQSSTGAAPGVLPILLLAAASLVVISVGFALLYRRMVGTRL